MAGQTPTPLFQEYVSFSRNLNSHFVGNKKLCIIFIFHCISFKDVVTRRGSWFCVNLEKC